MFYTCYCSQLVKNQAAAKILAMYQRGQTVSFTATASNIGGGAVTYNFKVNGFTVQNTSSNIYTSSSLINSDVVSCTISIVGGTCLTTANATSTNVVMNIVANTTPTVSIIPNTTAAICTGNPIIFTATPINIGVGTVTYNFKVNGVTIQNTLSYTFTTATLLNGDIVTCNITIAGANCLTANTALSNAITVSILPPLTTSIFITASATNICAGVAVTFNATSVNGGANPIHQWKINGMNVGLNTASFTSSTLSNGDIVSCSITSNATCVSNPISISNNITISVNASPNPSLIVTASDNNICPNVPITFTATSSNISGAAIYQWQLNGSNVGINSPTYFNSNLSNSDVVKCILTTSRICSSIPVVLNSNVTIFVKSKPIISFNPVAPTIIIGNSVLLMATVTGNVSTYLWTPPAGLSSTSANNPIANPQQTTTYNLRVTSTDNCFADSSVTVKVLTNTFIPNSFTPNKDGKNDVFRIPPSAALNNLQYFIIYNRFGNKIFETKDIAKGWDGTFQGTLSENGAYIYIIKAFDNKGEVFLKGTVILIR